MRFIKCIYSERTVLLNNTLYLSDKYSVLYNIDIYNLEERGSGLSVH
jgi:hypothetical protein